MPAILIATTVAMVAFAANSLLARLALADGAIDAASYTVARLVSGAAALGLLLALRHRGALLREMPGNWLSAAALTLYALAFSYAYLSLGAATGALILFASVQATMIAWSIASGDMPTRAQWTGFAVAFAAFVYLLMPGIGMPDPPGAALMMLSGAAWGVYSIRGRAAASPLAETSGNFVRAAPLCLPLLLVGGTDAHVTAPGLWLAITSGVVASGLGYAIWYRALPGLGATRAAIVQLSVPVIAAAGAILFLAEPLTTRFVVAAVFVLGGIGWAIAARGPAR